MREQSGVTATVDDKKTGIDASRSDSTAIETDSYLCKISSFGAPTLTAASAISSHPANTAQSTLNSHAPSTTTAPQSQNAANEDISPEGLL